MTGIERTAYPRFMLPLSRQELHEFYTPLPDEIQFVQQNARGDAQRLGMMALLKSFRTLGYFPEFEDIPGALIDHLRRNLQTPASVRLETIPDTSLYRYHQAIRRFMGVTPYTDGGQAVAEASIRQVAVTMNRPEDLISVAAEELVRQRFELPGYSTLDRMVARIREEVNRDTFAERQLLTFSE